MSGYKRGIIVPMTASFMTRLDEVYSPVGSRPHYKVAGEVLPLPQ